MAKNKTKDGQDTQALLNRLAKAYVAALEKRREETQIESPILGEQARMIKDPWTMYENFYNHIHYSEKGFKRPWRSAPKSSKPIQAVETITTLITDQPARVEFLPVDSEDMDIATKVSRAFDWWRTRSAWDFAHTSAVRDSRKFSVGWLLLERDEEAPLKQSIQAVHPDHILVSPNTTFQDFIVGKMPDYLIYTTSAQFGDLKTRFPDADWKNFNPDYAPDTEAKNPATRILQSWFNDQIDDPTLEVGVWEFWLKDDSKVVFEEDIEGDYTAQIAKPLYKNGRRIIVAGGIILHDEENEYAHGRTPFMPIVSYPQTNKFYSHSDIGLVLADTVLTDDQTRILADSVYKSGGGKLLVNTNALMADPKELNNDVAQVVPVNDIHNAMLWVPSPTPNRSLMNMIDHFEKNADDAVGSHDISRGIYTPGNKTASEIGVLVESDRTRVRAAVRVIGKVNEIIAQMWLSNLTQFSDWETFIRINRDDGSETTAEVVTFSPQDLERTYNVGSEEVKEHIEFDINVVDGSTMPTRAQDRFVQILELFDRGIVDRRAVLEVADIAGWRTIMARMEQAEQAQMQAQMQAHEQEQMPEDGMGDGGLMDGEEQEPLQDEASQVVELLLQSGVPQELITDEVVDSIIAGDFEVLPPEIQQILMELQGGE